MHQIEVRRQLLHLLYGPLLIMLHKQGLLPLPVLAGLIVIGAGTSYLIKHQRLSLVRRALLWFERPHHMEQFPGRGILFFTIGAFLCFLLFPSQIAYAGIFILSVGDAVCNVCGRHFGRLKNPLNPEKYVEGTVLGLLASIPAGYYFFPDPLGVTAAAAVAMLLEIPHIRLFDFEIDDNLIIPVAASFTLTLFQ